MGEDGSVRWKEKLLLWMGEAYSSLTEKKRRRSNLCNQRVKNIAMTVGEMLGGFTAEVSLCKASIPPSLELGDNPPYLGITFFLRTHFCYSEQHVWNAIRDNVKSSILSSRGCLCVSFVNGSVANQPKAELMRCRLINSNASAALAVSSHYNLCAVTSASDLLHAATLALDLNSSEIWGWNQYFVLPG